MPALDPKRTLAKGAEALDQGAESKMIRPKTGIEANVLFQPDATPPNAGIFVLAVGRRRHLDRVRKSGIGLHWGRFSSGDQELTLVEEARTF